MNITVTARVEVTLPITFAQIIYLKASARSHYDGHCRSCGEVGGFIYGWWNQFWPHDKKDDDEQLLVVNFRELDTLFKIIEFNNDKRAREIRLLLCKVRTIMNQAHDEWRKEIVLV